MGELASCAPCPLGIHGSKRPVQNTCLPDVGEALWALITRPPDLAMAGRPDENVAQVHVEPVIPQFLQLVSK